VTGMFEWMGVDFTAKVSPPSCATPSSEAAVNSVNTRIDYGNIGDKTTIDGRELSTMGNVAAGATTFVIAYAVHKVFAPVRIATTLAATPLIVRSLRAKGILKPPKTNTSG